MQTLNSSSSVCSTCLIFSNIDILICIWEHGLPRVKIYKMSETEDAKKNRILKDYGIEDEKPWGELIVCANQNSVSVVSKSLVSASDSARPCLRFQFFPRTQDSHRLLSL